MSKEEMNIQFDMPKNRSNVIKVIGVGGGGSNAINHMFEQGITGVDFVISNTDSQALENSTVPTKVQLGVNLTEGLGAGANPEIGEQAALESFEELKMLLDTNTKMVFITAGMGGGTGTGAAPIIAKQARDMDILTVGIVTIPFKFEGKVRNAQAQEGVKKLRQNVDSLIVIDNNKLREVYGNLGFKSGFSKADEVLATAARGIAEVITHHYTQNIDLRDAKTVLSNSGTAIMGSATATGGNRAQEAIEKALDSPLLNDNKIAGAKNVLLLIVSGNEEITLDEIGEINDHIQSEAGHSANIIMGVGEDPDLGEAVAVTIIATGFDAEQQNKIINTESKKIIHTLEDEQKAVQDLSLKNKTQRQIDRPLRPSKPIQKQPQSKKIVHTLEAFEQENESTPTKGLELVTTTEIIKNIKVDYTEVKFDEDDFIFIDAEEEANQPEEKKDLEDNNMLQFDFPIAESTTQKSKPKSSFQGANHPEEVEIDEATDAASDNLQKEELTRYSLEDYMEKERELTNAKPSSIQNKELAEEDEFKMYQKKEDTQQEDESQQEMESIDQEEVDPLNSPISQQIAARASQRRAYLKNFNYKFRSKNNIDEIEKQPAYKRAGINLDRNRQNDDPNLSRSSINEEQDDNGSILRKNNSFLHDNVD